MPLIFFYIFATLSVICAIAVISFRNTLSSAFALVLTLFGVACIYVLLEAHFLAIMQILVYAGAVMVLFIFVIMLMNLGREELLKIKLTFAGVIGVLIGGYLLVVMALRFGSLRQPLEELSTSLGTIQDVGRLMFSDFLVPFEVTSILLLVAVIGVVTLGRKEA